MSNVNSYNYKQRLDSVLKNCRQQSRPNSSDKSPQSNSKPRITNLNSFTTTSKTSKQLLFTAVSNKNTVQPKRLHTDPSDPFFAQR